jgi:hypothetical protein
MKDFLKRLPAAVILTMAAVLGVLLGIGGLVLVTAIEQRGRWQQWEIPPGEEVRELVTASEDYVVVATADGTLYEVACGAQAPDAFCWTEIDAAPEELVLPCEGEQLAPPPAGTAEQIATCLRYEFFILTQYALLEDGTLWRWQVEIYPLGQVVRGLWMVLGGLALGIVVGIIILSFRQQE